MLPVAGLLLALALGGRWARGPRPDPAVAGARCRPGHRRHRPALGGAPLSYTLGGWAPPLGVASKAHGFSAVLLLLSPGVLLAVGHFARRGFEPLDGGEETRKSLTFWVLLLGVWAGLNTVALAQDLFTLFVALELGMFLAVPLVALDGRPETVQAALRYLLFALLGSVLYLAGAAPLLRQPLPWTPPLAGGIGSAGAIPPAVALAAALMTAGLMAKTALSPCTCGCPPAMPGPRRRPVRSSPPWWSRGPSSW